MKFAWRSILGVPQPTCLGQVHSILLLSMQALSISFDAHSTWVCASQPFYSAMRSCADQAQAPQNTLKADLLSQLQVHFAARNTAIDNA